MGELLEQKKLMGYVDINKFNDFTGFELVG